MGITYEVDKDYNNAFIAYRNAWTIYNQDYQRLFRVGPPQQLKEDLLRTAWLSGLKGEFKAYKDSLRMPDYVYKETDGELIFFWHNGLAPVKAEWGVDFVISGQGGVVYFTNAQMGLSFPFSMEGRSDNEKKGLANLDVFRVAFPKYLERSTYYSRATINANEDTRPLQLVEDVNQIAFKCLQERMGWSLVRPCCGWRLKKRKSMN